MARKILQLEAQLLLRWCYYGRGHLAKAHSQSEWSAWVRFGISQLCKCLALSQEVKTEERRRRTTSPTIRVSDMPTGRFIPHIWWKIRFQSCLKLDSLYSSVKSSAVHNILLKSQPSIRDGPQERLCCRSKYFPWLELTAPLTLFYARKILIARHHCALFKSVQPCMGSRIPVQWSK